MTGTADLAAVCDFDFVTFFFFFSGFSGFLLQQPKIINGSKLVIGVNMGANGCHTVF